MTRQTLEQSLQELERAGSQPKRFSFLVNSLRRVLWPFMRPYNVLVMQKAMSAADQATSATEQARDATARIDQLCSDLPRLVITQSRLHSDVTALVNRYQWIEKAFELQAARLDRLAEELESQEPRLNQLTEQLPTVAIAQSRLDQELKSVLEWKLDAQRLLILSPTSDGVFLLKPGDLISEYVRQNGTWDEHIARTMREVAASRKGTAIDVGAHIGLLSAVMARYFERVLSFEPNQFTYQLLVANMALNSFKNVECMNEALFSREAELSLGKSDEQEIPLSLTPEGKFDGLKASNLGAYTFTQDGTGIFSTFARPLDCYDFENVAFIKIDTQGSDGEVIRGAMKTIRRCKPTIVFEWEDKLAQLYGTSLKDVWELLGSLGYSIEILKVHNDKQTDYLARPLQ